MGRLSEYSEEDQERLTSRFHSDTLPRTDKGIENWTTEIKLSEVETTPPIFCNDMFNNRDFSRGGGRILPHKGCK